MKEEIIRKKETKLKNTLVEMTPRFISAMLFGCAVPQTILLYKMIWSDPCSDTFFQAFELSMGWIAALSALEGAAFVALGYIDYKVIHNNT